MIYAIHFFTIQFQLESPLRIGSGEKTQIVCDEDGVPYVPATSMAGILRHNMPEKEGRELFGYVSRERESHEVSFTSRIFISHGWFKPNYQIIFRNGVALDEYHTAIPKKKYLLRAVERGAVFTVRFEIEFENEEQEKRLLPLFLNVIEKIQSGEITLGAKQTRGFGKLSIQKATGKRYAERELKDSLEHRSELEKDISLSLTVPDIPQEMTLKKEIQLWGTLCIRDYTDIREKNDVHYSQKCSLGLPVIPATSWAGAFRRSAFHVLKLLHISDKIAKEMLDELFGKDTAEYTRSNICFEETLLTNEKHPVSFRPETRNSINRVSGGSSNGALYKESYLVSDHGEYKGKLVIHIRKNQPCSEWGKELIELLLIELNAGRIYLGGSTAIGRGLFKINDINSYVDAPNLLERIRKGERTDETL